VARIFHAFLCAKLCFHTLCGHIGLKRVRVIYIAEETPELYLKLATECMKQVDGMISGHMSTSLKFNRIQCQYLADRLKMAVRSGEAFAQLNNVWLST
jgi:D-ribose pyranose/furanose isomerase RbsD